RRRGADQYIACDASERGCGDGQDEHAEDIQPPSYSRHRAAERKRERPAQIQNEDERLLNFQCCVKIVHRYAVAKSALTSRIASAFTTGLLLRTNQTKHGEITSITPLGLSRRRTDYEPCLGENALCRIRAKIGDVLGCFRLGHLRHRNWIRDRRMRVLWKERYHLHARLYPRIRRIHDTQWSLTARHVHERNPHVLGTCEP